MSDQGRGKTVVIYLRNHMKIAKKININSIIKGNQLYELVSKIYQLKEDNIHLYYSGQVVDKHNQLVLEQSSIVHIVDLQRLRLQRIEVNVKRVTQVQVVKTFQVKSDMKIKQFIDEHLFQCFGVHSSNAYLVNMGRQLDNQLSFLQQQIQTKSQLICIDNEPPEEQPIQVNNLVKVKSQPQMQKCQNAININIRDQQSSQKVKEIYPSPNFKIDVPDEVNISSNKLNLIFDSKIRKSSSVMDIDFSPDDIIQEEQIADNEMSVKSEQLSEGMENTSSHHSFQSERAKVNSSNFDNLKSRNISDNFKEKEISDNIKSRNISDGEERQRMEGAKLLYAEDVNRLSGRGMMKDIIDELNDRSLGSQQKGQ